MINYSICVPRCRKEENIKGCELYESGELESYAMYNEGMPIGGYYTFYENGKVKRYSFFSKDRLNDHCYYYDESGKIVLEIPENEFQILVDVADSAKANDVLLDCLINAYGVKRKFSSSEYEKEKPYKEAVEIIELANSDKKKATAKLEEYVQKKWLEGHSDYGWTRAHKEVGYYGLWSFEAAAIAKIFDLDDSKLKDDNHYPYDLAHYKNGMTFNKTITLNKAEIPEDVQNDKLIPANPELEQMIPNEFREEINQLLVDFQSLEDEEFWEKYNLMELWYTVEDYRTDKLNKPLIGNIVIDHLVTLGYILQLDYKEDIEDYVGHMKNYWKDSEVKLIRFELDNDQNYYAKVPVSCNLKNVYEAKIYE